jgi:hypothetical protein
VIEFKAGNFKHLFNEELIQHVAMNHSTGDITICCGRNEDWVFSKDCIDTDALWRTLQIAMSNRKNVYRVDPGERKA